MRVLIAGASGDLGSKVGDQLLREGHEVFGLTRSEGHAAALQARGIRPLIADLLDGPSLGGAVDASSPDAVVFAAIGLPERGPIRPRDLKSTNRLRVVGTRNLLDAAIAAGVGRFVGESIVVGYGYASDGERFDESSPLAKSAPLRAVQPALDAIREQERMLLEAASSGRIESIVVRLGFYYGRGVGSTLFMARLLRRGVLPVTRATGAMPWVELSDAARGVVAALERGRSGEIYNIVGDEAVSLGELAAELARQLGTPPPRRLPSWVIKLGARYAALMAEMRLHVSNTKARDELGWQPRFSTVSDGVREALPGLRSKLGVNRREAV